jgi:hypothetical protein
MAALGNAMNRYRGLANPQLSDRRVELVAVILTGIMASVLLLGLLRLALPNQADAIAPTADSLVVSELPNAGVVSSQLSDRVRARPIFWPSRRPVYAGEVQPIAAVETGAAAPSALDKVELRGIFGGGDSAGIIALVKGEKKRVMLGDKVVGWKLDSIDGASVTFVDKGKSKRLSLVRAAPAGKK